MNPKLKMKAEIEEKLRRKYDEKLKEKEKEFEQLLAEAKAHYLKRLDMALQMSADGALMAADDTFDVNAYSAEKFHLAHIDYVNDIARLFVEDSESDPECVFTKADIDRRLLQIVGEENFVPFEERYRGKRNE